MTRSATPWLVGTGVLAGLAGAVWLVRDARDTPAPARALSSDVVGRHAGARPRTGERDPSATEGRYADSDHDRAGTEPSAKSDDSQHVEPTLDDDHGQAGVPGDEAHGSHDTAARRGDPDAAAAREPAVTGDARALAARAQRHLADGEWAMARARAAECLSAAPDDDDCRRTRALAYSRDGAMGPRLEVMKHCLSAERTDGACLGAMVAFHLARRELAEAKAVARELDAAEPAGGEATLAAARVARAEGRAVDAREAFERACALGVQAACAER